MKDMFNMIKLVRALSPVNVGGNVAQVSQIVDRAGFDACTFAILTGGLTDADATFTVLLEEGNVSNLSDAAAVADADMIGTESGASFTFSDDNQQRKLGYKGNKRYLRLTITPANNAAATAGTVIAAVAILGSPRTLPQSAQNT